MFAILSCVPFSLLFQFMHFCTLTFIFIWRVALPSSLFRNFVTTGNGNGTPDCVLNDEIIKSLY